MKSFEEVYEFWFGTGGEPNTEQWFKKDEAFDQKIRDKFGPWLDAYDPVDFESWKLSSKGLLSLVILLDQFPRNAYRGTKRMFEYDQDALETAREGLERGLHDEFNVYENMFLTLPFEHSEDITDQKECVRLFQDMHQNAAPADKEFTKMGYDYAVKHMAVIERFGRFPHRNEILGRTSTPEEIAFLKTPGSSF